MVWCGFLIDHTITQPLRLTYMFWATGPYLKVSFILRFNVVSVNLHTDAWPGTWPGMYRARYTAWYVGPGTRPGM